MDKDTITTIEMAEELTQFIENTSFVDLIELYNHVFSTEYYIEHTTGFIVQDK